MQRTDLWKYCTYGHCRDMLLSFRLLGNTSWTDERVMACLFALSNHPERHYRQVRIPKAKGAPGDLRAAAPGAFPGGTRCLLVPDPLLKRVQRNILHHVLDGFSISDSATAYHKGATLLENARPHVGKPLVLKLDIRDFFGSITFPMVLKSAFPGKYFPPSVGTMLTALCCCRDRLPQGAPTSPAVSNLVLRPFDEHMRGWCAGRGIAYTRYCDDMTFSGDFEPEETRRKAAGFLRAMGFELNREKTRAQRRGSRQTVTGLVVNEKPQVPRDVRRGLRQEAYYCLAYGVEGHLRRSGAGRYLEDGEDGQRAYLQSLLGRIAYARLASPEDAGMQEAEGAVRAMIAQLSP